MKILILAIAIFLTTVSCQGNHPLFSYDILKSPDSRTLNQDEFVLIVDYEDDLSVIESQCNDQRFQECIGAYADDLGLEEISKDSTVFVKDLVRIVQEQGLDGLKRECSAGTNLKRCLGDQYDKCISENYLKKIGVEEIDAKVFVTLSVQMAFQCTTGLQTIINNWDCIQNVERQHRREFKQCQVDYRRKVQRDPTNVCKYTQEMVNCMTMPFKQQCPPEVYGVLCHSIQIAITTTLPKCSIICLKGTKDLKVAPNPEGQVDTMSSFLARTLLENIPTHQMIAFRKNPFESLAPTCDDKKFKKCAKQFGKDVGLPSLPKRAMTLASYLNQLIASRKAAGLEQICNASGNMVTCLGDQMESCFSAEHLEKLGVPATDILIYRELQAALTVECGAGYQTLHDNIDCVLRCGDQHQSDFVQCAETFARKIKQDPNHACDHAQEYIRCNTRLLQQSCGDEVSSVTCDATRAELTVPLPNCKNLTCASEEDLQLLENAQGFLGLHSISKMLETFGSALSPATLKRQIEAVDTENDESNDSDSDDDDSDSSDENAADAGEPNPPQKCNDKKFGQCLNTYAKQLGLKSFPSDPMEFNRAVQTLVKKYGKIGFKKICMSNAKLAKCVGFRQLRACFNLKHLQELGLKKEQAITYLTIGKVFGYECTKGFKTIMENWDCIIDVEKRQNKTFIKCGEDFAKKVKQDPKKLCKYAQGLSDCESKPFAQKCGKQVSQLVCQVLNVVFKPPLPKCQIKCKRDDEGDQDAGITAVETSDIPQTDEERMADLISA